MIVPVRARGVTLGVTTFFRRHGQQPFDDEDLSLAEDLVARAAVCVDNARRYTRERDAALVLQRNLLPHRLPEQDAVEVAACYRPADELIGLGGDWYDLIPLSGGAGRAGGGRGAGTRHRRGGGDGPAAHGGADAGRAGSAAGGGAGPSGRPGGPVGRGGGRGPGGGERGRVVRRFGLCVRGVRPGRGPVRDGRGGPSGARGDHPPRGG
ncbi:hypothetical protein GCM10020256_67620 [Streptomyces thermocoprophilus]